MASQEESYFIITLIRHGETVENSKAIMQGQMDTKLNETGKLQAKQLAQKLNATEKYDLIYSSDLSRAYETCLILVSNDDQSDLERQSDIIKDVRLRERCLGVLQGKHVCEKARLAKESGVSIVDYTAKDGETLEQVRERVVDFFKNRLLSEVIVGQNVLLVSHGGVIREIIDYFIKFGHKSFSQQKNVRKIPPNTSVNRFKVLYNSVTKQISSVECLALHDVNHLDDICKTKALNQIQINDSDPPL